MEAGYLRANRSYRVMLADDGAASRDEAMWNNIGSSANSSMMVRMQLSI